jgi:hypothetical protein
MTHYLRGWTAVSKIHIVHMFKAIMLLVLCGCEMWSLMLREQHRLGVYENKVLKRMFGPKREKVIGGCRRLHNEKFHNLYTSPNIIRVIRRMRWVWYAASLGKMRHSQEILAGKPEGKRPLRRPRHR